MRGLPATISIFRTAGSSSWDQRSKSDMAHAPLSRTARWRFASSQARSKTREPPLQRRKELSDGTVHGESSGPVKVYHSVEARGIAILLVQCSQKSA